MSITAWLPKWLRKEFTNNCRKGKVPSTIYPCVNPILSRRLCDAPIRKAIVGLVPIFNEGECGPSELRERLLRRPARPGWPLKKLWQQNAGMRGFSGGFSLPQLLRDNFHLRVHRRRPPIIVVQFLEWADAFYKRQQRWLTRLSGTI